MNAQLLLSIRQVELITLADTFKHVDVFLTFSVKMAATRDCLRECI